MVNRTGELGAPYGVTSESMELRVWEALATVRDPEIPPCSITDLGIVERVRVVEALVEVDLVPTFSGCPALDAIREDAEAAVRPVAEGREVLVRFVNAPPWTSDRISAHGRRALQEYGIEPPGERSSGGRVFIPLASLERSEGGSICPFCGSEDTVLESAFGPTLCRATHFCRSCRNPYESFKPKGAGAA
jgi:ring-1,2-phenylacetyl-CoA epoxidase subunit PaaD